MPAATGQIHIFGPYLRDWWKGQIAPETANRYRAILVSAAYTPDLDADQRYSHIAASEVYEGNWPQGGLVVTNLAVGLVTASDRVNITFDPVTALECTFVTPVARVVVVDWLSGADAASRRLAFTWSLTPTLSPVAGPVVVAVPNGLVGGGY